MKARRFFIIYADSCYGYLARKKKERTAREEQLKKARHVYHSGIYDAWNIYTENNELVRKAKKALDVTIHEVFEQDEKTEEDSATTRRLLVKATRKAYENFAEAVNHIWEDFTKNMERL